jgi:hypothetical protein
MTSLELKFVSLYRKISINICTRHAVKHKNMNQITIQTNAPQDLLKINLEEFLDGLLYRINREYKILKY